MASFKYYLHSKQREKSSLLLSVNIKGVPRIKIPVGISVSTKYWEQDKQRIKPTTPEGKLVNDDLISKKRSAEAAYTRLVNQEKDINKSSVLEAIEKALDGNITETPKSFYSFVEKHIERLSGSINTNRGTTHTPSTICVHRQSLSIFKTFEQETGFKIDFNAIDMKFYNLFLNWIHKQTNKEGAAKYGNNTIGKHIKNLKAWLNAATEEGLNTNLAFKKKDFRKPKEETITIALTPEEIGRIYRLELYERKELDLIRDAFLVGYFTGMRFSDFSRLKSENIIDDHISIVSQKTGKSIKVPIGNEVHEILDKHNGRFPRIGTNQHFNRSLKEIGKLAEINTTFAKKSTRGGRVVTQYLKKHELITTHTARRSFATNHYKNKTPIHAIMAITGHSTEAQFFRYIKTNEEENLEIIKAQSSKLIS